MKKKGSDAMKPKIRKERTVRLLSNSRRRLFRVVFSRLGIISLLFLFNACVFLAGFFWIEEYLPHFFGGSAVITAVFVLLVLNTDIDATAKITWLVIIMLFPIMGGMFFIYTQSDLGHRALKKRTAELSAATKGLIPEDARSESGCQNRDFESIRAYLKNTGDFVCYSDSAVKYHKSGEDMHSALLKMLEGAEKFIFLEFFIISEGEMWGSVLEILSRKAAEGVEVRVLYDGTCEFTTLDRAYPKRLERLGIKCRSFSPITPFVSTHYNYRDHRKIVIVDGKAAMTGGVNLSDEYINIGSRFGHWKDAAISVYGNAVNSFTRIFLEMWHINSKTLPDSSYFVKNEPAFKDGSYVIPYSDCPLDSYKTGERVYIDILNRARSYVYIMTPYLILDGQMQTALTFAAERGVDVRLILPGIPDKRTAYALAKTHYKALVASGVKIYEYSPGFVHSKVFLADGNEAVVGSINLDYRSLYHHFECAAYIYGSPAISDIKADFDSTFPQCREVSVQSIKKESPLMKLAGFLLKVIAPLM